MMRSRQLLFVAGRDEGAGDLIVLEGEDTGYLFLNTVYVCNGDDVWLIRIDTMFRYSAYHLVLHWNHYLCSGALSHLLAAVSPLNLLGTSFRFLCS
jgi:hypothetical protein